MEKRPTWTGTQIAVLIILLVTTNAVTASLFFFAPEAEVDIGPEDPIIEQRIIYSETEFRVSFDYRGQSAVLQSYRYLRVLDDHFEKEWTLGYNNFRETQVGIAIETGRGMFTVTVSTDRAETRVVNIFGDISVFTRHGDGFAEVLEIVNYGHTPVIADLYVLIKNYHYVSDNGIRVDAVGCDVEGNVVQFSDYDSAWTTVVARTICS